MRMAKYPSYEQFERAVARYHESEDGNLRYGQAYFNLLQELFPVVADAIRGTEYDPFHKDEVSAATRERIEALWPK